MGAQRAVIPRQTVLLQHTKDSPWIAEPRAPTKGTGVGTQKGQVHLMPSVSTKVLLGLEPAMGGTSQ